MAIAMGAKIARNTTRISRKVNRTKAKITAIAAVKTMLKIPIRLKPTKLAALSRTSAVEPV